MSIWYDIKKVEDAERIDVSEDGKDLEILFDTNYAGDVYITIPIKLILEVLEKHDAKENERWQKTVKKIFPDAGILSMIPIDSLNK